MEIIISGYLMFKRRKIKFFKAQSLGSCREHLQGHYCFLCFLRPPDECKNPDWSELIRST